MKSRLVLVVCAVVIVAGIVWRSRQVTEVFAQQDGQAQGQVLTPAQRAQQGFATGAQTPTFAGPPAGMKPLPIDLFTSKNFYKDQQYWLDQRYFRCNTPRQLTDMWAGSAGPNHIPNRIGSHPPTSAAWGDCSMDVPRDQIVSPYPYKTAKEHYEALLAAAKAKGGPTIYTNKNLPDWDGYYRRNMKVNSQAEWYWGTASQVPTILKLLTPEYQKRFVQMNYHEAVDNSPQWPGSFCEPEGFMRMWSQTGSGNFQCTMNPHNVQIIEGCCDNELRQILVGQTQHVMKVPQWYGETIGFWDGTTLVGWTANVQAWWFHTMFEYSSKMEAVETLKPTYDSSGKVNGLDGEVVFYDPVALVVPVRVTYHYDRYATMDSPARHTWIGCLSNIRDVNGRPKQLTDKDPGYIDYYGRPWAKDWEKYFEKGWDKPQDTGVPDDVLSGLK